MQTDTTRHCVAQRIAQAKPVSGPAVSHGGAVPEPAGGEAAAALGTRALAGRCRAERRRVPPPAGGAGAGSPVRCPPADAAAAPTDATGSSHITALAGGLGIWSMGFTALSTATASRRRPPRCVVRGRPSARPGSRAGAGQRLRQWPSRVRARRAPACPAALRGRAPSVIWRGADAGGPAAHSSASSVSAAACVSAPQAGQYACAPWPASPALCAPPPAASDRSACPVPPGPAGSAGLELRSMTSLQASAPAGVSLGTSPIDLCGPAAQSPIAPQRGAAIAAQRARAAALADPAASPGAASGTGAGAAARGAAGAPQVTPRWRLAGGPLEGRA